MSTDALPAGGAYAVAAYLVLTALLLSYFAIMAVRLRRLEREITTLNEILDRREADDGEQADGTQEQRP